MDYEDCTEKMLIRKNPDARGWSGKEIALAEKFSGQAQKIYAAGAFEMAEVAAYTSIFHSGRALLFSKGHTEKSHYCLFLALGRLYSDDKTLSGEIREASRLRESRHEARYGGKGVTAQEAEYSIQFAKRFLESVKARV
ncbi:MAG: HEPN domain-containing protein [Candidatus Bilamarchaeaceae archaeon]